MYKLPKSLIYFATLSLAGSAAAQSAAPAPPDLARTVEAFAGTWTFDATQVLPDGQKESAKMQADCKKTAIGRGVFCGMRARFPKSGLWEGGFLIGYDTYGGRVHFMGVTSDDSVHDHACDWKGDSSIVCESLKGGSGGQLVTEDLTFAFAPNTFTIKVRVTLKDGGHVLFDASGKRH